GFLEWVANASTSPTTTASAPAATHCQRGTRPVQDGTRDAVGAVSFTTGRSGSRAAVAGAAAGTGAGAGGRSGGAARKSTGVGTAIGPGVSKARSRRVISSATGCASGTGSAAGGAARCGVPQVATASATSIAFW